MSAIDWEHAPEIAKPTYEELEAMCWELTEQNAELREHVKMPDEPLEIDEKDFYVRAFIKWATEEQLEVKRLNSENAKLRELVHKVEHYEQYGCYECQHSSSCGVGTLYDDCTMSREIEREKRELGIEVDE